MGYQTQFCSKHAFLWLGARWSFPCISFPGSGLKAFKQKLRILKILSPYSIWKTYMLNISKRQGQTDGMPKQDFRGIIILASIPVWVWFTVKKEEPLQEDLVSVPLAKSALFIRYFSRSREIMQRKYASIQQHPPSKSFWSPTFCQNVFSFLHIESISICR